MREVCSRKRRINICHRKGKERSGREISKVALPPHGGSTCFSISYAATRVQPANVVTQWDKQHLRCAPVKSQELPTYRVLYISESRARASAETLIYKSRHDKAFVGARGHYTIRSPTHCTHTFGSPDSSESKSRKKATHIETRNNETKSLQNGRSKNVEETTTAACRLFVVVRRPARIPA